ncbi:hypothetical protein ACP275_08G225000 [Erythranthe tilingii]
MGFLSLLRVASMPIIQVLIIGILGAFMATDYLNLLSSDARKSLNKIVFVAFTPSLVFGSLAKTVTLQDIISWWFMPVNIAITFLVGGTFGWIAAKILKPEPYLQDLIIAICSGGNLGNILIIIVPAMCKENGNPFGDKDVCATMALSYVSFSMALGALYVWTISLHLIRSAGVKHKAMLPSKTEANKDFEANDTSPLLLLTEAEHLSVVITNKETQIEAKDNESMWNWARGTLHQLAEELTTPPILAAIFGLIIGAVSLLRNLIIGENAPLRVIYDSIELLADGTIPCITLILGGNLTQGLGKATLKPSIIIAVICVRYILLPPVGIFVVKAASHFGFLSSDPLYRFVLMIQFSLPPAMNIGTMTQLFDVAQEECSALFLWTYLVAALAITGWSTVFMWILS